MLRPFILGEPGAVEPEDQGAVAAWVQKTALVAMLVSSDEDRANGYGLPVSEYRELYALRDEIRPLPASQFWIGRYDGARTGSVWVTPLVVAIDELPEPVQPQAYAMTIVLGQLALHGVRFTTPSLQLDLSTPAQVRDTSVALLEKDIGAIVVPLPGGERLVVRRSDGRSIYATRDLGAIKLRRDIFDPTDINFGFYVDADTGKKLSSRDSVAGVTELLAATVRHFRARSAEDGAMTEDELDEAAQQLAVGSIVFNDLKRDMKGPLSITRGDLTPIITEFEKSGGPYVVYSACRARAILRKYGKPVPHLREIDTFELSDQEALPISKVLEFPDKVIKTADEDNPSILVRHLPDIAGIYNSYYASTPVLERGKANKSRLMITRAARLVLTNGLKFCHVACPPKI